MTSSSIDNLSNDISILLRQSGAAVWAITAAGNVHPDECLRYAEWISSGAAAGMDYLSRNATLRATTSSILPQAQSIIICAFPYPRPTCKPRLPIASYALLPDYHHILKQTLSPVVSHLEQYGFLARTCVDSAPLAERYWAVRARLGSTGLNCQLNVPGCGSRLFIASILTSASLPPALSLPDVPPSTPVSCNSCGKCLRACPANALNGDGTLDARKCLNYLTIEHKGEFPENTDLHGRFFGCDICTDICPLNSPAAITVSPIPAFSPLPEVLALDTGTLSTISSSAFNRRFRQSPISRPGLKGLLRNLKALHHTDIFPKNDPFSTHLK